MREIDATQEEIEKVGEMHHTATTTPVITMACGQPSFAETAWDNLRAYLRELGDKYDFDPESQVVGVFDGKLKVMSVAEAQSL